jgi:uncharacterized protein YqfB (UPF0267 family)
LGGEDFGRLMVAYSFKARFRAPIEAGSKRQTIRADRKRHARPGESLQLYTGMRTKYCTLIGRAICLSASAITLYFDSRLVEIHDRPDRTLIFSPGLDKFARADGFDDWAGLEGFWRAEHPDVFATTGQFHGMLIRWTEVRSHDG